MPLYEYECPDGHRQETFTKVENYLKDIVCSRCGKKAHRILSVPNAVGTTRSGRGFKNLEVPLGKQNFANTREVDAYLKKHGIEKR